MYLSSWLVDMPRRRRSADIISSINNDTNSSDIKDESKSSRRKRKSEDNDALQELLESPKQARLLSPPLLGFPSSFFAPPSQPLPPIPRRHSAVTLAPDNDVTSSRNLQTSDPTASNTTSLRRHLSFPVSAATFYGSPNRRTQGQNRVSESPLRRQGASPALSGPQECTYTLRTRKSPVSSRTMPSPRNRMTSSENRSSVTSQGRSSAINRNSIIDLGHSQPINDRDRTSANVACTQNQANRISRSISMDMSLMSSVPATSSIPEFSFPACPLLQPPVDSVGSMRRARFGSTMLSHCPVCPHPSPPHQAPSLPPPPPYLMCPCHTYMPSHPACLPEHQELHSSHSFMQEFGLVEHQQRHQLRHQRHSFPPQILREHGQIHHGIALQQQTQLNQMPLQSSLSNNRSQQQQRSRQNILDLSQFSRSSAEFFRRNAQAIAGNDLSENIPSHMFEQMRTEYSTVVGHANVRRSNENNRNIDGNVRGSTNSVVQDLNNNHHQFINLNAVLNQASTRSNSAGAYNYISDAPSTSRNDQTTFSSRITRGLYGRRTISSDAQMQHVEHPNTMSFDRFLMMMEGGSLAYMPLPPSPPVPVSTYQFQNYEALLGLAQQLSESKPKGLSKMEIDQLPLYHYNSEIRHSPMNQTSCVICMCDFENRQRLRVLCCEHEFHSKCIDKWLKTNRSCPVCRGDALEKKSK